MLQFIYAKPSSNKTNTVLTKIKELTLNEKKCMLIVPEQYTFETEKAVLHFFGDKVALNINVLSFTRLIEEVGRISGGLAGTVLSDCDKVIFMKKALKSVSLELTLWSNYTNSITFAKTILDTVGEFKINSITPNDILSAADTAESSKLKAKLKDLALIYRAYDEVVGEKFIDPADNLTKLYNSLIDCKFFEGKTVFIDSFKGFTGAQYKIIERILSQADDVYISLINNPENSKEFNVFTNIRATAEHIIKIANRFKLELFKPIILNDTNSQSIGITELEKLISGDNNAKNITNDDIFICKASTLYDEANFVARTIRKFVRTGEYRFRDFVIIARDAEMYKQAISSACKQNKVALFFDNRTALSAFPLARAAEAAINSLDFSTNNILQFHKTGLGTLSFDEISVLENYTYLWNINGKAWLEDWVADPRGFINDKDSKTDESLKNINLIRQKAILPIINFKKKFNENAKEMATALIELFEECNCSEKLAELSQNFTDTFTLDYLKQAYEEYIKILDSLVSCFCEEKISKNEFLEAITLAVSLTDIGTIPQTLDEVTFGSADRIRTSHPKITFILGANQGVFPQNITNSGVFNTFERKNLIDNGLNISDNSIFSSIDEDYLVYCNLCSPKDKLYICFSKITLSGETLEPSAFVGKIKDFFEISEILEPCENLSEENLPETADSTFSEFCKRIITNPDDAILLKNAISNTDNIEKLLSRNYSLNTDVATELYGKNIRMSASRFDTFSRCHFSYFCRYGLNTKKLQPADFDVMQRGTIVHYVLEKIINNHKENSHILTANDLDKLTDKYINEYLDSILGYRSLETKRLQFVVSRISRSLKDVVHHIFKELNQSGFKPVACELKIGQGSDFGELFFDFDGGKISLSGSIDRVDEYNGYIRVIDYKTGTKSFKLPDILFGLNLQMLIYLYALTRRKSIPDTSAAAILYQPSKRDINDNGMAMNGLLQSDIDLIKAMDKEGKGEFVPKLSLNKDGTLSKRSNSFIEPQRFTEIFDYIEKLMRKTGNSIIGGDISVSPIDGRESPACKYCDYSAVCGIEDSSVPKVPDLKTDEVFEKMKEAEINGI